MSSRDLFRSRDDSGYPEMEPDLVEGSETYREWQQKGDHPDWPDPWDKVEARDKNGRRFATSVRAFLGRGLSSLG